MNRRQFTASLGALSGTAALPLAPAQAAVPAAAALAAPPKVYLWAQLIARAQANTSPAMLARLLWLSPEVAQSVFDNLVRDGVLRTPAVTGIAQAVQPVQATGHSVTTPQAIRTRMEKLMEQAKQIQQEPQPLVKADAQALEYGETAELDQADACPCEPLQESPRCG